MREFVGIDLGQELAPNKTVCKLRHPLKRNCLGQQIFKAVAQHRRAQGFELATFRRKKSRHVDHAVHTAGAAIA
jgi:hypothetical protein